MNREKYDKLVAMEKSARAIGSIAEADAFARRIEEVNIELGPSLPSWEIDMLLDEVIFDVLRRPKLSNAEIESSRHSDLIGAHPGPRKKRKRV